MSFRVERIRIVVLESRDDGVGCCSSHARLLATRSGRSQGHCFAVTAALSPCFAPPLTRSATRIARLERECRTAGAETERHARPSGKEKNGRRRRRRCWRKSLRTSVNRSNIARQPTAPRPLRTFERTAAPKGADAERDTTPEWSALHAARPT